MVVNTNGSFILVSRKLLPKLGDCTEYMDAFVNCAGVSPRIISIAMIETSQRTWQAGLEIESPRL